MLYDEYMRDLSNDLVENTQNSPLPCDWDTSIYDLDGVMSPGAERAGLGAGLGEGGGAGEMRGGEGG